MFVLDLDFSFEMFHFIQPGFTSSIVNATIPYPELTLTSFTENATRVTGGRFDESILFSIRSAVALSPFFAGWCFPIRICFHLRLHSRKNAVN